jgi:hypothetical protein
VVSSQVASSAGNCFHFTKFSSINLSLCLIQRVSRIFSRVIEIAPSSVIGGSSKVTRGGSPIYFFKRETWKMGWVLVLAGNCKRYATLSIFFSIQ